MLFLKKKVQGKQYRRGLIGYTIPPSVRCAGALF